jgi:hypothetical protein
MLRKLSCLGLEASEGGGRMTARSWGLCPRCAGDGCPACDHTGRVFSDWRLPARRRRRSPVERAFLLGLAVGMLAAGLALELVQGGAP